MPKLPSGEIAQFVALLDRVIANLDRLTTP